MGCSYVLIKGAHENTPQVVNVLYDVNGIVRSDAWQRLPGSFHGSGCTLSSAIAASLAHGMSIADSVYEAQEFTWHTLKAGFRPGMGQYIPDRFFGWKVKTRKRKPAVLPIDSVNRTGVSGLYAITPDIEDTDQLCAMVYHVLAGV